MCLATFVHNKYYAIAIMTIKNKFKTLIFIVVTFMASANLSAQDNGKLFQYPVVPDSKTTLSQRCNYLVDHFWDRANIKQSFSTLARLEESFRDWIDFMPYATADTVHMAVERFIKQVEKTGHKNLLSIGRMAEANLYSDTAQVRSEEIYLPFCKAVAANKKIPSAERARFEAQVRILEHTQVGMRAPDFDYITPDGRKCNLRDVMSHNIILFFNDPDCVDCRMAKARLAADYHTKKLIDAGLLKIVSIYPGEVTEEWKAEASTYPVEWETGAADGVDEFFALDELPVFYYLNSRHKIVAKNLMLDNLLKAINLLDVQQQVKAQQQEAAGDTTQTAQ